MKTPAPMSDERIARFRCPACGQRQMQRVRKPFEYQSTYDKRNPTTIRIPDLEVIECMNPACDPKSPDHAVINDDAATWRVMDETCRQLGLLTPQEIRAGRKKLGLKQSEFQALLGLGGNTLSRWEKGHYFQSRAMDLLMRLMFECPSAFEHAIQRSCDSGDAIRARRAS